LCYYLLINKGIARRASGSGAGVKKMSHRSKIMNTLKAAMESEFNNQFIVVQGNSCARHIMAADKEGSFILNSVALLALQELANQGSTLLSSVLRQRSNGGFNDYFDDEINIRIAGKKYQEILRKATSQQEQDNAIHS